jgi:hypothetical protein
MYRIDYSKDPPLEHFHGIVCGVLNCPSCGADLTARESVNVTFGLECSSFDLSSRLERVGHTGVGLVEDMFRLVACGYESMIACQMCGEDLSEHEEDFTWTTPSEYRKNLEAAAEVASKGGEDEVATAASEEE